MSTLKIAAISDIHARKDGLDDKLIEAIRTRVEEISPDVFIIAGDLNEYIDAFSNLLSRLHIKNAQNLYVAGNHDIWFEQDKDLSSLEKYSKLIGDACSDNGFIHLPDTPYIAKDIAFVGSIGWSDYSFQRHDLGISDEVYESKQYGDAVWRDLYCIDWDFTDKEATELFNSKLQYDLQTLGSDVKSVVYVSHHLPFRELTLYKGYTPWDFFASYMGATSTGELLCEDGRVILTISGHSHIRNKIQVNGITATTVPVGYGRPHDENLSEFVHQAVAEIEITNGIVETIDFVKGDICEGMPYTH
ncbi:MAG: metallophosphoesterase family protein [Candidatus Thorarchaeota archaeon]